MVAGDLLLNHRKKEEKMVQRGSIQYIWSIHEKHVFANTALKHRVRYKATWPLRYLNQATQKVVKPNNQTSYTVEQKEHTSMICQARSYEDQKAAHKSDHSMMITMMTAKSMTAAKGKGGPRKLDLQRLSRTKWEADGSATSTAADFEKRATPHSPLSENEI